MKRRIVVILAIALTGLVASCSQSPDCFRENVFCVGLVTNTQGINDYGLNQRAWDGMRKALKDGSADHVAYIESVDARDYGKNIEVFAKDGYDVIVTVGPAMDDETLRFADLYADTVFIGLDQPQEESRPNLLSIVFPEDQMGFWAGALAARWSRTGVVGAVCETSSIDSMWRYCEGFRRGALHANENIKTWIEYRNKGSRETLFVDSDWGYAAAQSEIQRGADVIFAAGGATAQGALRAAAEAGVYAIGAEEDQARSLTEARSALITSVYGRADLEVQKWLRLIKEKNAVGGSQIGAFGHADYPNVNIQIPESLQAEMERLLLDLMTGAVKTGTPATAP